MKSIYKQRLMNYAKHLKTITNHPEQEILKEITIYSYTHGYGIVLIVKTPYWVFDELVEVFDEWECSAETGDPVLKSKPDVNTANAIFEFFGIEEFELFAHYFDLEGYQQPDKWGGNVLNLNSSGRDIAKNICESLRVL